MFINVNVFSVVIRTWTPVCIIKNIFIKPFFLCGQNRRDLTQALSLGCTIPFSARWRYCNRGLYCGSHLRPAGGDRRGLYLTCFSEQLIETSQRDPRCSDTILGL